MIDHPGIVQLDDFCMIRYLWENDLGKLENHLKGSEMT